jgi:hypothetical protein
MLFFASLQIKCVLSLFKRFELTLGYSDGISQLKPLWGREQTIISLILPDHLAKWSALFNTGMEQEVALYKYAEHKISFSLINSTMSLSYCFISLVLFCSGVQSATNVGGVLLSNTVWTSNGDANPYYLTRDVQISPNITLTIQAGVEVRFNIGDFGIVVKGYLQVQGTASQPVLFHNGSANHTKWMINFQSTQLGRSSINGAIFNGPQRGLQMTSAVDSPLQNRGVLLLQSVTFLNNATLVTNGK